MKHMCLIVLAGALAGLPVGAGAAEAARTFASPDDAMAALVAAAEAGDRDQLHALFGDAVAELVNPDPVQGVNEVKAFALAAKLGTRLVPQPGDRVVLEVGADHWPFPVPIVKSEGRWVFDAAAGREELLNRRIGRNELMTLAAMRAYVAAQCEYAARDRDGDEVLEYAQKGMSEPGQKDGLYWPPGPDGELSPLGPLVVRAHRLGYGRGARDEGTPPDPFHGYIFRILVRQGQHAPGGAYDYVINGNMIGGFALIAWPVRHGESGVMTFIVNQQGRVYERDLGADTAAVAGAIEAYDPDPAWRISVD